MEKKKLGELTLGEKIQWEGCTWTVIGHVDGKTALLGKDSLSELAEREIRRLEVLKDGSATD